jgi:hypothetical protein
MHGQIPVMGLNQNSEIIETLQQICSFVSVVHNVLYLLYKAIRERNNVHHRDNVYTIYVYRLKLPL